MANNVQAIKALPEPVHSLITGAFSASLHDVFLSAVPLVVVALVVALFLKEKPLATRDATAAGTAEARRARGRRRALSPSHRREPGPRVGSGLSSSQSARRVADRQLVGVALGAGRCRRGAAPRR